MWKTERSSQSKIGSSEMSWKWKDEAGFSAVALIGNSPQPDWPSLATSMPRILARLIERTAHKQDPLTTVYRLRPKRKSLLKPVPSRPSFNPADYARSILLSSPETNPITHSNLYQQHKSLPPRFRTPRRVKREAVEYDPPREMSDNEHQWWSSPYRM